MVSKEFYKKTGEEFRHVLVDEKGNCRIKQKNIKIYHPEDDEDLGQVFQTFDFEVVVYFSFTLDGSKKIFDELEKLEAALYQCKKHRIPRFFYIRSNDMEGQTQQEKNSRHVLTDACENLCRTRAERYDISVEILNVPFLYSTSAECQLFKWAAAAVNAGEISFPGARETETDFLREEDLGELIQRMLDDPSGGNLEIMSLEGGNSCRFEELGDYFKENHPQLTVNYENRTGCIPVCCADERAKKRYGWEPSHTLKEDIAELIDGTEKQKQESLLERIVRKRKVFFDRIRVLVELVVLFVLAEFLNYYFRNNAIVNFMDFRLVYTILMGTLNGMNAGAAAALLSSVGYGVSNASSWQIVFYNVENWLPFASYFLLGAVSGYTRDRRDTENEDLKAEYRILEEKYGFLNGLYTGALESKEQFGRQILGYKDSFGKMYSVVKKLNSTLPEQVFFEAVNVLEEILENHYVAIYSIKEGSPYARLYVCSGKCSSLAKKSIKITDYPKMLETLEKNETFINQDSIPEYPAYATPVFRNSRLVGMIFLMQADYRQMNMEFSNKFRIMTDMIRDSLIRAMDYYEQEGFAYAQTRILDKEHFAEILQIKKNMRQKQYMEYTLLKINQNEKTMKEMNDAICALVRDNDVLGIGEDGELYLLLSQTKWDEIDVIEERMKKKQITFEVVKE